MLQLNILLLHSLQRVPGPCKHNRSCQVKMVTQVQQRWYGIWEATGDVSWKTGNKLWQTHSESNKRSIESEAALQNHFHFHLELIIELSRLGLNTSLVTEDITVENSPKMYDGELAEAVEPSWLTQWLQKSWWIKLTKEEEEWSLEWIPTCSYFFLFVMGPSAPFPLKVMMKQLWGVDNFQLLHLFWQITLVDIGKHWEKIL